MTRPRVHRRAWTVEQDRLLGKVADRQIARRLGRSLQAVIARRQALRIRNLDPPWKVWTPEQDKLLGRVSDRAMAARLGLRPFSPAIPLAG